MCAAPGATQQRLEREESIVPMVSVMVRVRSSGAPIAVRAVVRLYSTSTPVELTEVTKDQGQVTFQNIPLGDYQLEVSATGYAMWTEEIRLLGATTTIMVELKPSSGDAAKPAERLVLAPKSQKEIARAVEEIRQKHFKEAEERLLKVIKRAPKHPDAYYLLAMIRLEQQQRGQAEEKLRQALQIYPDHAPSLISLSGILIDRKDYPGAVKNLAHSVELNPDAWRAHEMLAVAFLMQSEFDKARVHAARALELAQGLSPNLHYLHGVALAGSGEKEKARVALQRYIELQPDAPPASSARAMLTALEPKKDISADAGQIQATDAHLAAIAPPPVTHEIVPPPKRWPLTPVDEYKPEMTEGVVCALPEVLEKAGKRIRELADNLEKVTATEDIESVELDSIGNRSYTQPRRFYYTIEISEPRKGLLAADEYRRPVMAKQVSPETPMTNGLMAIGLIFHPYYARDFEMTCEGLTEWRGQPTWSVYFHQRANLASRIRTWYTSEGRFPLPLKGRAWIAAKTFELVRLDTNLVEPQKRIQLEHEHVSVEYRPVFFEARKLQLWLPESAEVLTFLKGKTYHLRHRMRDYLLFSVEVDRKVNKPKETQPPEEPQKPPAARE